MTLSWSRTHTLIAGLALIALTNAIALGGVAWNRSGEPESMLKLTQRELQGFAIDREGGGLQLSVSWRVLSADANATFYWNFHGTPEWLDEAKLASLGFDVSPTPATRGASSALRPAIAQGSADRAGARRPGAAKRRWRARGSGRRRKRRRARKPARPGRGPRRRNAAVFLKNEETANSRLFAVDAGRDAQALRAKYPDRTRYAIVQGKVRLYYQARRGKEERWMGYIEDIENDQVNVPLEFRKAVEPARRAIPMAGPPEVRPGVRGDGGVRKEV